MVNHPVYHNSICMTNKYIHNIVSICSLGILWKFTTKKYLISYYNPLFCWITWRSSNHSIYAVLSPPLISARLFVYIVYDLVDYLGFCCANPRWHFWKFMLLPDIRYILWCAVQSLKHRKNHDPVQKPIRNCKRTSLPREAHCSARAPIRKS